MSIFEAVYLKPLMSPDILVYLPQRPPFVMISNLLSADGTTTRSTFDITEDNILVTNGLFTEPGLIENMAQTAGTGTGYHAKENGQPTPLGYIAMLKNVQILSLPKVNETITTEVTFEQAVLNFHHVKGRVMLGEKEIASCEFKIFVSTNPAA